MNSGPHLLQAGPLRVRYENGFLRSITLGDTEVLRMIYFAVRDQNWRTAGFTITDEHIDQTTDSFRIQYTWQTDDLGIQLTGLVTIKGDATGQISVHFYSKALNSFQKNRIGLCVLHPIDGVIGQPAQIIGPDRHVTNGHFPVNIDPYQPFISIQTLRWRAASGTTASGDTWQLDFSGDVFETEDQRNWTDASFKTYSTPLTQPFPVTVSPGDEFRQRVVFERFQPTLSAQAVVHQVAERNTLLTDSTPTIPRLGVGQWAGGLPLTDVEASLLRQLQLSHLRADVFFRLPNWQTLLTNAIADAQKLAVPLELAVFFNSHPIQELQLLQHLLEAHPVAVRSILLFNAATLRTSTELLQVVVPVLQRDWSGLEGPIPAIGGGTDDNFVEWNRHRFAVDRVDFVTYSVNPQVHAFDDLTLLENIAGQVETALSARLIGDGKPVHISPITLLPRFTTLAGTATERLTAPADPRQTTDFGADWTRRSLTALSNAGVASITYYQTHGPGGLVNGDTVYPVFDALKNRR